MKNRLMLALDLPDREKAEAMAQMVVAMSKLGLTVGQIAEVTQLPESETKQLLGEQKN